MSVSDPLLSIITPSYNQGKFIEDALVSVMRQKFDNIEHIVVDGGSEDDTITLLKDYESKYNLQWISEPDGGQSEAINKGIEMAQGEFIGWINADDYYLPGAFKAFQHGLDSNPNADIIYGDLIFVNKNGEEIKKKYHTRPSRFVHKYWQNYTANHCTFIRQSVFKEVGGVREDLKYVMDIELFWRLLSEDIEFLHKPKLMAAHRYHDDAKTTGELTEQNLHEKQYLKDQYSSSIVEEVLPSTILKYAAVGLQILLLTHERHWVALQDMFDKAKDKL
jgi:glycosyltransferase involved in cell wall biosynthesis